MADVTVELRFSEAIIFTAAPLGHPAELDVVVPQGATFRRDFELKSDESGTMVPVDLTGATIAMQARAKPADTGAVVLFGGSTTDSKITITDAANGLFTVDIPPADTLMPGIVPKNDAGVWDLFVTLASGKKLSAAGGAVRIVRRVTV